MTEHPLLQQIKNGDDDSLKRVYLEHRQAFIFWLIKTYRTSEEQAREIYQLVILVFYDNIMNGKLTQLTGSLRTYLFSIGKYKWLEMQRAKTNIRFETEQFLNYYSGEEEEPEAPHREEEVRLVGKALKLLGDPCKTLLELFYYNKLSMDQITDKMKYKNRGTTKNLKYKCIKRLQKIYTKEAAHPN